MNLIKEKIEQHYVLVIASMLFLASAIFLLMPMGEEPPFLFTVAIITGLATKATVSFQIDSHWNHSIRNRCKSIFRCCMGKPNVRGSRIRSCAPRGSPVKEVKSCHGH